MRVYLVLDLVVFNAVGVVRAYCELLQFFLKEYFMIASVTEFDLESIKKRIIQSNEIDLDLLDESVYFYRVFLHLKKLYPEEIIVPTKEVDIVWHNHILFTKKYHQDCEKIFGKYLHHSPVSEKDAKNMKFYQNNTLKLVRENFPEIV